MYLQRLFINLLVSFYNMTTLTKYGSWKQVAMLSIFLNVVLIYNQQTWTTDSPLHTQSFANLRRLEFSQDNMGR